MATQMGDFVEILLRRGIVSPDQVAEAEQMARNSQSKLGDCLIQLGYVTGEDITRAMAEFHDLEYVDLTEVTIPEEVVEMETLGKCSGFPAPQGRGITFK